MPMSQRAQKKVLQKGHPLLGNHAKQPLNVVPLRTQHRMLTVAGFTIEMIALI